MTIKDYILKHEGLRLKPYKDIYGRTTIGVGRNLDGKGITEQEAWFLMQNDIDESIEDLKKIFPKWNELSPNRQMVLIDMRYQLGYGGFRGFGKMIKAIKDEDWLEAAKQIKDSNYYRQVTERAERNIHLMEVG